MTSQSVSTLTDLVGEWRNTQKLMFVFVQFTYFMYGWQTLDLVFLTPNVKVECDFENSDNGTSVAACSYECPSLRYDHTEFYATLTEKLGLVCSHSWLQSFSLTLLMISGMVANLLAGELSDRIGRRKTVLLSLLPYILGCLIMLFPLNYPMFAVGICLTGMAYVTMANFSYVLLFELCGEAQKSTMGVAMEIGYGLGAVVLGALSWWLRHWFYLQIINTALVVILAVGGFLPESTEWLMKKGRNKEATETLKKIIRVNRKPTLSDNELQGAVKLIADSFQAKGSSVGSTSSMKDLVVVDEYRSKTICVCYFWFSTSFVFYGISLNVNVFGSDLFLNFILSSVSSLPSIVIIMVLLKFVDIKWIIIGCNSCAAIICYFYVLGQVLPAYKTAATVLGWFFMSPALIMLYPYTSALFPTEVRGKAIGLASFMSRLGAALSPFTKELGISTKDYVPMLIFGALCTLLVVLILRLGSGARQFDVSGDTLKKGNDNLGLNMTGDITLVSATNTSDCHEFRRF